MASAAGRRSWSLVLGLLACLAVAPPAAAAPPPPSSYFPGQLVVRFAEPADAGDRAALRRRVGAKVRRALPVRGAQLLELAPGRSVREAQAAFERDPEVLYAEPNYRIVPDALPDDPRLAEQWDLPRIGMPAAWELTRGSRDVVAAVLDSGVEVRHPDLVGTEASGTNLWRNPGETGGGRESDGVDDDGNGYVDDWQGWNFGGYGPPYDSDPTDYNGHGTGAAGVIGAIGDNGVGITGVSQRVRLMPLQVWGEGSAAVASAVTYAARNGARVANGSFGIPYAQVIEDALAASPELLLSVSAGNFGRDVDVNQEERYPCISPLPNVICVAATDGEDRLLGWSNYGARTVDLGAPGVDLLSLGLPRRLNYYEWFDDALEGRWTAGGTGTTWARTDEPSEWGTGYGSWLDDSPGEPYPDDSDTWIALDRTFDLSEERECFAEASMRPDLGAGDVARLEGRSTGRPWTTIVEATGTDTVNGMHDLAAFEGRPGFQVRVRLRSDGESNGRGVQVTFIHVVCRVPPFRGDEYALLAGTSFAAPHVTGAAALLLAHKPELTAAQLRAALLDSVEPQPTLQGKTATGGRLDVHRALTGRPAPPPITPEPAVPAAPVAPAEAPPPAPAPAPALAADRRAPACIVRPRTLRRRPLRVAVRCDEAARVRLSGRGATVRARVAAGRATTLRLKLPRRATRAALRLVAADAAGNRRALTRRVRLRRR